MVLVDSGQLLDKLCFSFRLSRGEVVDRIVAHLKDNPETLKKLFDKSPPIVAPFKKSEDESH